MEKIKPVRLVSLFLAAIMLFGSLTGCRRVKSHKEYVNSEYEFTVADNTESSSTDSSSSSLNGTISSGGSSGSSFNSGGVISMGKKVVLEYTDNYLYSSHPTFYWSELGTGQKVNISLYDTSGKEIFNKRGLIGTSYKCEQALEDGKEYIIKMTYTNFDGSENVVNTVGENGKKVRCIAKKAGSNKNYSFKNSISLEVLNNYLDKVVQYNVYGGSSYTGVSTDEAMRFILETGTKYVLRAAGEWYPSYIYETNYPALKAKLEGVHSVDPDVIFEACIFEVSSPGMNNIPIPSWVFEAFDKTPENRNFNVDLTVFKDGYGLDYWEKGYHIPDITTLEMQMFVYYRACTLIDVGFEAFHLGQVELTGKNDTDNVVYTKLINMIREYAKTHARRGYVIINAHNDMDFLNSNNSAMLVDMIVAPNRVHAASGETSHATTYDNPQRCQIDPGYWNGSVIYNHNPSRTSPSGWYADKYPYLVQFDNYGDVLGNTSDPTNYVWGKDEVAWYKEQPDWYRKEFMNYLRSTIAGYNENGHAAFFGYSQKWGPEGVTDDKGDEEIIKEFFAK